MTESDDIPPPPEDEPTPTFAVPPGGPDAGTRTYFASPPELSTRPAWGLADGNADSLPTIPEFELIDQIGFGGMGVVYKARQIKLDRTVALKVIRHDVPRDPDGSVSRRWKDRFEQEAKSLARLQHPNIVQIHDAGEANGRPYLVMEYVGGGMLDTRLRDATLPTPATAAEIVRTLARAAQVAHEQHVVHRDLKPANVLITPEGVLKIADFGLARLLDETNVGTGRESVAGTPGYMAPEQVRGEPVTPLVDVYALGAILYKLLVNRPPFSSDSKSKLMRMVCEEIPAPPHAIQPGVPADLEAICLRCIEKEPTRRYKSAKDVADDLDRYLRGEPTIARPVGWIKRRWMWAKRRPTTAALGVVAGLLLIAGATIGVISIRNVVLTEVARRAEAERETEQTRRESAEQFAEMNQISAQLFATEQRTPATAVVTELGWRSRVTTDLRDIANSRVSEQFRDRLRGLYAAAETRIDLEEVGVVASDLNLSCLAVSPDGTKIAGGDTHGAAIIGDVMVRLFVDGKHYPHVIRDGFRTNSNGIRSLAFSHDSRWLAIGSRGGKILILDTTTPAQSPRELTPSHQDQVKGLGFTRDDTKLASVSLDTTIAVWDVNTGKRVKSQVYHKDQKLLGIAFSPTEDRFVVCSMTNGSSNVTKSLEPSEKLDSSNDFGLYRPYQSFLFSPNGNTLALASFGDVHINGVHTNFPIQTLRDRPSDFAHSSEVTGMSMDSTSTLLATGGHDNYLKLWDATTGQLLLRMFILGDGGVIPAFNSVSGELLVFANRRITRYQVIRPDTVSVVGAHETQVGAVAFAGDSSSVVSVAWHEAAGFVVGEQAVWNLATHKPIKRIPHNRHPNGALVRPSITIVPGSQTIVCGGKPDADFQIWNWPDNQELELIRFEKPRMEMKSHLHFSRDGQQLWGIQREGKNDYVRCISWPDQNEVLKKTDLFPAIAANRAALTCLDVSRTWAAVGSDDCTVKLITTANPTGDWQSLLTGKDNPVHSVALSPDESLVLAGTRSGQIMAFRLPDGKPLDTPLRHLDRVEALAFTPNGQILASGGRDNAIRLWKRDGDAFQSVVTYPTTGPVTQVTFSPEGSRLAFVVEGQRAFNVWDLAQFRTKLREYNLDW